MSERRVLIVGLASWWGGRVAGLLEHDPLIGALVGVDVADPSHALERTEFVRTEPTAEQLRRIMRAAAIDTLIDTRAATDPMLHPPARAQLLNVGETRGLLEACAATPTLRHVVLRSSAVVYADSAAGPAFLAEPDAPSKAPSDRIRGSLWEYERMGERLGRSCPELTVTILRLAPVLPGEPGSSHFALLSLPVLPGLLGFDPRLQFVHEDDAIGSFAHAAAETLPGAYNVAADGVLALSEVASLLGKPLLPLLPPWGIGLLASRLRPLRVPLPLELIARLRHGRALDNRRLKATGFRYRYTSRETVLKLRAHQRLRPLLGAGEPRYRYQAEVEEFLRRSPYVRRPADGPGEADGGPLPARGTATPSSPYAELSESELIEMAASLERSDLELLLAHEQDRGDRPRLLAVLRERLGADPDPAQESQHGG